MPSFRVWPIGDRYWAFANRLGPYAGHIADIMNWPQRLHGHFARRFDLAEGVKGLRVSIDQALPVRPGRLGLKGESVLSCAAAPIGNECDVDPGIPSTHRDHPRQVKSGWMNNKARSGLRLLFRRHSPGAVSFMVWL